jgi:hypothetical protein
MVDPFLLFVLLWVSVLPKGDAYATMSFLLILSYVLSYLIRVVTMIFYSSLAAASFPHRLGVHSFGSSHLSLVGLASLLSLTALL